MAMNKLLRNTVALTLVGILGGVAGCHIGKQQGRQEERVALTHDFDNMANRFFHALNSREAYRASDRTAMAQRMRELAYCADVVEGSKSTWYMPDVFEVVNGDTMLWIEAYPESQAK